VTEWKLISCREYEELPYIDKEKTVPVVDDTGTLKYKVPANVHIETEEKPKTTSIIEQIKKYPEFFGENKSVEELVREWEKDIKIID